MASAIAEKERRLAALKKARTLAAAAAQRQQHTLIALASAYGLGWAEKKAFQMPSLPNVAPEVTYGSIALVGAYMLKNKQANQISQSLADGMLSVALYKAGRTDFATLFKARPAVARTAGYY